MPISPAMTGDHSRKKASWIRCISTKAELLIDQYGEFSIDENIQKAHKYITRRNHVRNSLSRISTRTIILYPFLTLMLGLVAKKSKLGLCN